jgi:hypothetical protein
VPVSSDTRRIRHGTRQPARPRQACRRAARPISRQPTPGVRDLLCRRVRTQQDGRHLARDAHQQAVEDRARLDLVPAPPPRSIESRWVSQPLAFAGELRPPRLNHQPHLHRRTAVTAAFSLEDVAACAAAACPPRRLLPPPPPPCAPALPCDGSPNNTAAASNARSSSCTAPSCRFCFSCAAFLRAPLALPSSSSSSSSLLDSSSSLAASSTPPRVAVRVASEIQRSSVAMSSSFLPACAREIASSLRCSARMAAVALTVPFSRSPSSSSSSSSSPPSSSSSSSSLSSSSSSSSSSSACKSRVSRSAVSTSAR